jgi:polyribonucleotide nucleotidyltransferase
MLLFTSKLRIRNYDGLITDPENIDKWAVLSDILGDEDRPGNTGL